LENHEALFFMWQGRYIHIQEKKKYTKSATVVAFLYKRTWRNV